MTTKKTKTAAERRRECDARKKEKGLVRISIWVHESNREYVLNLARHFDRPLELESPPESDPTDMPYMLRNHAF